MFSTSIPGLGLGLTAFVALFRPCALQLLKNIFSTLVLEEPGI